MKMMKMTMTLSLLLLTQNFIPVATKIDSSIVAAAHLFPSLRGIQMICYLNCGDLAKKDFLKSDCLFKYQHIPANFQLVGKIFAGPKKKDVNNGEDN